MKKIFAINAGSSSLKFQLLEMPVEKILVKGIFEKIGSDEAIFKLESDTLNEKSLLPIASHQVAVDYLLKALCDKGIIASLEEIDGIGHRVAHGGEHFTDSALVDERVEGIVKDLAFLAPSHNPVNLVGIHAFQKALPSVGNVAVFDTAFHQSMTPEFYRYPLPVTYYEKYRLRKYGFHGTSHKFIAQKVTELLQEQGEAINDLKIINCHLGNGASLCAIKNGESVNTSMGFTPLAGLMMGTRSGDIDPMIVPFLMEQEGLNPHQVSDILNKESGLLAVSELSNDLRDIIEAYDKGEEASVLALDMFINRIVQTIAGYITDLGGLDVLVFTAGIGENSRQVRKMVVDKLGCFGLSLDETANQQAQTFIHHDFSTSKIAIVPTNEELMIARDTMRLLGF